MGNAKGIITSQADTVFVKQMTMNCLQSELVCFCGISHRSEKLNIQSIVINITSSDVVTFLMKSCCNLTLLSLKRLKSNSDHRYLRNQCAWIPLYLLTLPANTFQLQERPLLSKVSIQFVTKNNTPEDKSPQSLQSEV